MSDVPDDCVKWVERVVMNDYSDLIKRLRNYPVWTGDCLDAADAIEELVTLREKDRDFYHLIWEQCLQKNNRIAELEAALGKSDE